MFCLLLIIMGVQSIQCLINPKFSAYGIVVTDNRYSSLYLIKGNHLEKLVSGPGCGRYYTLSKDGRFIGFKLISEDGSQVPVIYDIINNKIDSLFQPRFQVGQVSFDLEGRCAFTIGNQLVVMCDDFIKRYPLSNYANIAPISPDGGYVVFNDASDQLWLFNLSDNKKICITDHKQGYLYPVWSNDSRFIAYTSMDGFIKVYDIYYKKRYNLGKGMGYSWTFDNKHLIFYTTESDGHRLLKSELFLERYDGRERIQLTATDDIFEMNPGFYARDKIIFDSYKNGEIWTGRIKDNQLIGLKKVFGSCDTFKINYYDVKYTGCRAGSLDVPYLHQVYDVPDWFDGHWACAPTTAMMGIAFYYRLPFWDCRCSSPGGHISHYGRYICERYHYYEIDYNLQAQDPSGNRAQGGYGYMWYDTNRPYTQMALYLSNHGLNSWRDDSPTFNETTDELNAGYPYGMCVGLTQAGHLVLAVGCVSGRHILIFNDPYGNKNTPGYPSYDGKYARYDWPGYNNGYENLNYVYWTVGMRGVLEPLTDTIVDDLQFNGGFYLNTNAPSSMKFWRDREPGFRHHFWWTYTTAVLTEDTCYAIWTPVLEESGDYEVFSYIPGNDANAATARYQVFHKDGVDTVVLNQADYNDEWASLGVYPFDTAGGYVYLGDGTGIQGEHIGFDAMRWSFKGSGVVQKRGGGFAYAVSLYPQPAKKVIHLRFNSRRVCDLSTALFDITGRCLYQEDRTTVGPGLQVINLSYPEIPCGVYLLRISLEHKDIFKKIVFIDK